MNGRQLATLVGVMLVVGALLAIKSSIESNVATTGEEGAAAALPKMLELGSVGCIACQKMEPIVADLKSEDAPYVLHVNGCSHHRERGVDRQTEQIAGVAARQGGCADGEVELRVGDSLGGALVVEDSVLLPPCHENL